MKLSSIIAARNRVIPTQDLLFTVDASIDQDISIELQSQVTFSGVIDWGDGSSNTILSGTGYGTANHTFSTANTFQVKVSGTQVPIFNLGNELNVVSVENLGNVGLQVTNSMFESCSNLTSANLGNYITSIGEQTFISCTSLTSITIPNSVTSIGSGAFWECSSLTSINIPDSVTSIEAQAFIYCESLTSVIIPSGVTSIGNSAFNSCRNLITADLPAGLTEIKQTLFNECNSLQSTTIPAGVTVIESQAFSNCTSLASISCLATTAPTLTGISHFLNVLSTIDVPVGATGYGATYGGLTVNYVL